MKAYGGLLWTWWAWWAWWAYGEWLMVNGSWLLVNGLRLQAGCWEHGGTQSLLVTTWLNLFWWQLGKLNQYLFWWQLG